MNLPKPSQNPSLSRSGQGIALSSIIPSTKSQQSLSYYSLQDKDSSTRTNSTKYFQQIPNQESLANQHIINDPNQPLTLSSDLTELEYHEIHLAGRQGWQSPVKGILSVFIFISFLRIYFTFNGESESRISKSNGITPAELLYRALALASLIPIAYFLNHYFHELQIGWTNSVERRIRWCWLFVCFGLSIASMIATLIFAYLLMPQKNNPELNGSPSSKAIEYALIIIFVVPLQAAGEEFAFRGYLTQAFSGLLSKQWRWMGIPIQAILFTMAHGFDQTFPMVFDRFLFGLGAGILVIWTGGLEAGIALHALTNMLLFTVAVASDKLDQLMKTESAMGSQWLDIMAFAILRWTIYVVLILLFAPRHHLQTKVSKAEVRGEILPK